MIVQVNQGLIEGKEERSILTGLPYCAFLGIPYAVPPVGDLRFKPPLPIPRWQGIFSATLPSKSCIQQNFVNLNIEGSEDCLYLNVYTPQPPIQVFVPKAVMIYIHGGAFMFGSASPKAVSPDYLMPYDVILVTLNYRLNILGFLNMDIPECSGNCGLKDQLLALKWVKENIRVFGGDPDNITLFGDSAGGSSVHLHMLSPLSRGLFHRAIIQSGSAFVAWALTDRNKEAGFRVGQKLGFQDYDALKLVNFLKLVPIDDLVRAAIEVSSEMRRENVASCKGVVFIPSVEAVKTNAFLPDHPRNLIRTAVPMPVLTGVDECEGVVILLGLKFSEISQILTSFADIIRSNTNCPEDMLIEVADKVRRFYCGDYLGPEMLNGLIKLYTDLLFLEFYEAFDYVRNANIPVYCYEFIFDGRLNKTKYMGPQRIPGAKHNDELGYLFHIPALIPTPVLQEPELTVLRTMCEKWTNFAKTGNPTSFTSMDMNFMWTPCTTNNPSYLRIGYPSYMMNGRIWQERYDFWRQILNSFEERIHH